MVTEVKTEINAPASAVYQTLMDFGGYPEWTTIMKITGTPTVGSTLSVHIKLAEGNPSHISPVVTANEPNKELRWKAHFLADFLFSGDHYFIMEDTPTGCLFTHGEINEGLIRPIMRLLLGKSVQANYAQFNEDLKKRVESTNK